MEKGVDVEGEMCFDRVSFVYGGGEDRERPRGGGGYLVRYDHPGSRIPPAAARDTLKTPCARTCILDLRCTGLAFRCMAL